jgi:hypothetical protein
VVVVVDTSVDGVVTVVPVVFELPTDGSASELPHAAPAITTAASRTR